jgi:hypothetical protein
MSHHPRGFRNRYRSNMPWTEVLLKDLQNVLFDFIGFCRNGFQLPVVVAYPDYPSKKTTIYKISRKLGFRITNKKLKHASVIVWFHDTTHASSELLVQHYPGKRIINKQCTDISKKHVDGIHQSVFGYSTIINPRTFEGPAVVKSDINALHDGEIIRCPIANPSDKAVYQIVIDNKTSTGEFRDYRVPVIGGSIPLVYSKYKHFDVRFTNSVHRSELHRPEEIFSAQELTSIQQMAERMGAEFCEFDVLRDNASELIYIIDVNKTPYGPPSGLKASESREAVQRLTDAFRNAFVA